MIPIIFINKNHGLDSYLKRYAITECHVIQTLYHQEARAIYQSLAQRKISYRKIRGRDYIQEYQKTYADFIGKLNISNAGQPWWALDLTNKNPITTRLFYSVYFTLLIHKVIDAYPDQALLVITDDKALYQQTALNFSGRSECQVVNHIQGFSIKRWLQAFIPLGPLYKIIWALSGKFWARVYLPRVTTAAPRPTHLVMSLLYDPCFKAGHYQDVYFGPFVQYLLGKKIPFLNIMEVCAPYRRMMRQTKAMARGYPVYPKEYFLTVGHIFQALGKALSKFYTPIKGLPACAVEAIDVTFLLKHYLRQEYISTRFCANLLMHHAFIDISRCLKLQKIYYPFENRSFEKMIILAVRQNAPHTALIAYQHASATLRHTNFLLSEGEEKVLPLPDVIFSLGQITKDFIVQQGGFPSKLFVAGCALRQKPYSGSLKKRSGPIKRILVTLATNIEEYVKALLFLEQALAGSQAAYEIWIRPHPVFSLDEACAITGDLSFDYHKADKESLADSFVWADLLVFVHSMVSIEGLMHGLPCLRLVVDSPVDPDPLLGLSDFKWDVSDPGQMKKMIAQIDDLGDNEFYALQEKGRSFAADYIRPVNETFLNKFLSWEK